MAVLLHENSGADAFLAARSSRQFGVSEDRHAEGDHSHSSFCARARSCQGCNFLAIVLYFRHFSSFEYARATEIFILMLRKMMKNAKRKVKVWLNFFWRGDNREQVLRLRIKQQKRAHRRIITSNFLTSFLLVLYAAARAQADQMVRIRSRALACRIFCCHRSPTMTRAYRRSRL